MLVETRGRTLWMGDQTTGYGRIDKQRAVIAARLKESLQLYGATGSLL
jgi:hypothetical protein